MKRSQAKLAKDVNTIQYASTEALEAERRNQLGKGRAQSLRLLQAIEAQLKSRAAHNGRRPSIEDYVN